MRLHTAVLDEIFECLGRSRHGSPMQWCAPVIVAVMHNISIEANNHLRTPLAVLHACIESVGANQIIESA